MVKLPFVIILGCLLTIPAVSQAADIFMFTGRVVAVSDGDTITVLATESGKPEVVRLMSVDCPEKSQAYGMKAKEWTASHCFNREVTVVRHGYDRNRRSIGDVILPAGEHLNAALVKAGLAWWYRKYAPDDKALSDLEDEARREKIGLWNDAQPVAPWDYRHKKKTDAIDKRRVPVFTTSPRHSTEIVEQQRHQ